MVIYTCPRCGFSNKIKTKIRSHFLRKNICQPKIDNIDIRQAYETILGEAYPLNKLKPIMTKMEYCKCNFCNKEFDRKYNLIRHLKGCRNKDNIEYSFDESDNNFIEPDSNIKEDQIKKPVYTESEKDIIIASKDKIIEELKNQIELLLKNQGSNNVHNNITYNTSIVLNAFGKENTSYITGEYLRKLIKNGPLDTIPKLLEHIHFNPEHIENHNIKIPNRKQGYAEIYNGETWQISDKKQTIEAMSDKAYNILNTHYTGGNEHMNKFKTQYENNDLSLNKRLYKDTEIMILNSQKKI